MSNWMIPYNYLDPSQTGVIGPMDEPLKKTNMWLVGYPGSGKSVILTHLARKAKMQHNKVAIVTYTKNLGDLFNTGLGELNTEGIPVMTPRQLLEKDNQHYDFIICDEIQDLSLQTLRNIKNRCTYLIAAGDANQSIYSLDIYNRPVMKPDDPHTVLAVQSQAQNIIYRLTPSMVEAAIAICPNLEGMRSKINQTGVNTRIMRRRFSSFADEREWVYENAKRYSLQHDRTAILLSTRDAIIDFANSVLVTKGKDKWTPVMNKFGRPNFDRLNSCLANNSIKMQCVLNDYGSLKNAHNRGEIILTTYHSAKGLDFENVYLPCLDKGLYLLADQEKSKVLLMVALTRSSKNLTLSYSSAKMSDYVSPITNCTDITMSNQANTGISSNRVGLSKTNDDDDMY